MAFAATVEWDVRTTGSNSNGGGFDPVSGTPGTDYSQQDAAQVAYTDLVIDATTNTKCTSAATPFTSAHVGNIINVTGGTGFTVQRVQIMSVAANVATCDKSLGTLGSTGGTGNLGGSLLTIGTAAGLVVNSNKIHIKAGTYTVTATITINNNIMLIGYNASHNDGGTKPLVTTATNSTNLFTYNSTVVWRNISMSNTASTRAAGVFCGSNFNVAAIDRCVLDGFTYGYLGENGTASAGGLAMSRTEVKNCTTGGVFSWFQMMVDSCYIHDNTGTGIKKNSTQNSSFTVIRTILANNTVGIDTANNNGCFITSGCTIANNTSHGITGSSLGVWLNNIIYGNGGWGINGAPTGEVGFNAYGSNTSGNVNGTNPSTGDVTLTANPFTNAGAGDYSLNTTAGGGAACRDAGLQWGV